jgi:molybdate transport system substrate-binding protein
MMSEDSVQTPAGKPGRMIALLAGLAIVILLAVGVVIIVTSEKPQAAMIYVGSSMRQPMEQCAAAYEKTTGVKFALSFADSGEVLAQAKSSGMGEMGVLHEPYLTQGKKEGWARETFVVASMTPVIAVAKGNPKGIAGLKDFLRADVRIGLTDYRYATSGAIARDAMMRAGILEDVLARRPYENKSSGQTGAQVTTGALDAVIIWDAVAGNTPDKLDVIPIESQFMPPAFTDSQGVTYYNGHVPVGILILKTAKDVGEMRKFIDFILSPEGQKIWHDNGYSPPTAATTQPASAKAIAPSPLD